MPAPNVCHNGLFTIASMMKDTSIMNDARQLWSTHVSSESEYPRTFPVKLAAPRAHVKGWERILTLLTLFLSTGALLGILIYGPSTPDAHVSSPAVGSLVTEIVWAGLYTLFIVIAFVRRQRLVATLLKERTICLLLGLAILSTAWSDSPSTTLWNCARLFATTLFGIYLAKTYGLEEIFGLVAWALAIAAVLSIVFALVLPEYGIDKYFARAVWRGVFDQKNGLGNTMAIGALTWLIFSLGAGRPRWLGLLMFTTCSLLVLFSGSKTSLVVESILLFVMMAFGKIHRSVAILAGLSLMVLVAVFVVEVQHPIDAILGLLNRSEDLTGRVQIWALVREAISKRPLLGYGYMAFWRGADGPSADVNVSGWIPPSAHNGFLDLALYFGVFGPVLFAVVLAGAILFWIRVAQRRSAVVELFPVIFLLFIMLSNVMEGSNISPNALAWDLFVAFSVKRSVARSGFRHIRPRPGLEMRSRSWRPPTTAAAKSVA